MRLATVVLFALFLLAPGLAALFGVRGEVFENRRPAAFPEWQASSWLDAEAYAQLGDWLKDALPLRAQGVALDSWIDYEILGDSPTADVLVGDGGELFLTNSIRGLCGRDASAGEILDVVDRYARILGRADIPLFVVFSPNKAFLYPERLPARAERLARCSAESRAELREALAKRRGFVFIDLWAEFERQREAGQRMFPRLGRHWESWAGIVQARAIVDAIEPGLWDPGAVVAHGVQPHRAELPYRFMNLDVDDPRELYTIERPGVHSVRRTYPLAVGANWLVTERRQESDGPPLIPGRTLVVFDSFFDDSSDLYQYMETAVFVHWELMKYSKEVARLFRTADRVVLQVVEDRRAIAFSERRQTLAAIRAALR